MVLCSARHALRPVQEQLHRVLHAWCSCVTYDLYNLCQYVPAGTESTVQTAINRKGLEKLKRVVSSLTSNGHVHTLLFHWFGNYTLQDLVEASSKLRRAALVMLHRANVSQMGCSSIVHQIELIISCIKQTLCMGS